MYTMVLSFGIGYMVEKYKKQWLFFLLCCILIILYQPWTTLSFWKKGDLTPGPQVLSTQLKTVDAIYNDARGEHFSAYVHTPPVYDYAYRYLFSWKGKQYGYIPPNEKQKIVYVILEGVPEDQKGAFFKNFVLHLKGKPVLSISEGSPYPIVEKFRVEDEDPVDPYFFPQL